MSDRKIFKSAGPLVPDDPNEKFAPGAFTEFIEVIVKEYLESHEFLCSVIRYSSQRYFESRERIDGGIIKVDPFVTCAIETTDDNYREIGKSMVGKTYRMEDISTNSVPVYMPNSFVEVKEPAINIVVRESEDSPDSFFIEVENDEGESIKVGEWIKKDDEFMYLRIKQSDIK